MERATAIAVPAAVRRPARLLRLASDERLVALLRAGDEAAFEALYDRHHATILGFCRHMLGTREEAEDALQHTFLAAFRDLVRSTKPIELRPWLFAIARNRCVSLLRARRPHVALELAEPATDGLVGTVERREDVRELLADLARLPEDQRAALLLAELGALDHAGIATVLGCPRGKVKALVFQARSSLIASREARMRPCEQIRIELASASGGALRRGPLRRHLLTCAGCRAFKADVAAQRGLLALALPVVPGVTLKARALAGAGGSHGGAGALAGAPGGALLGTVASSGTAKVAVSLAVAAVVASGSAITVQQVQRGRRHFRRPHPAPRTLRDRPAPPRLRERRDGPAAEPRRRPPAHRRSRPVRARCRQVRARHRRRARARRSRQARARRRRAKARRHQARAARHRARAAPRPARAARRPVTAGTADGAPPGDSPRNLPTHAGLPRWEGVGSDRTARGFPPARPASP